MYQKIRTIVDTYFATDACLPAMMCALLPIAYYKNWDADAAKILLQVDGFASKELSLIYLSTYTV